VKFRTLEARAITGRGHCGGGWAGWTYTRGVEESLARHLT
jgi:hypothetical protein